MPNSGHTSTVAPTLPSRSVATRRISRAPGRKTSTSPSCDAIASRTAETVASSRRCPALGGRKLVVTGNARPLLLTTGASPSSAATRPPSIVADITSRRRSGRRSDCVYRARARPVSPCNERSWNSSKQMSDTPSSVGSSSNIRVSTPSVTTSMRVPALMRVSPRIRHPTVSPTAVWSSDDMRMAAALAASRRGSSSRIRRPSSHGSSRSAIGTAVVLPAPGGATSTAALPDESASRSAGTASITGRSANRRPKTVSRYEVTTLTLSPRQSASVAARRLHRTVRLRREE